MNTDQGPGPSAGPYDFTQPLPLVSRAFVVNYFTGGAVKAVCKTCHVLIVSSVHVEGWEMTLIRHAWEHGAYPYTSPSIGPKRHFVRAPRVKRVRPSTPADLESRSLFEESS